jgi:Ca2+-binding EF-hand superfamily protein
MLRNKSSVEGSGTLGSSSSRQVVTKKSSIPSRMPVEINKSPQDISEEERFRKLKEGRKGITRDVIIEYFQLELSPYFANKLFDVMGIAAEVDFEGFRKVLRALESASVLERQRLVFSMFDPNPQGRISKADFKKTVTELLNGATKQFPISPNNLNKDASLKLIPQTLTDFAFEGFCLDEQRGMDFKEWLTFAVEDLEVNRLVFALDKRVIWSETMIRRRFLV